jgi:hypothetical protein
MKVPSGRASQTSPTHGSEVVVDGWGVVDDCSVSQIFFRTTITSPLGRVSHTSAIQGSEEVVDVGW